MAFDLAMRGGLVVDGTGAAGYEADVAVDGEEIAAMGRNLDPARREIGWLSRDDCWHRQAQKLSSAAERRHLILKKMSEAKQNSERKV